MTTQALGRRLLSIGVAVFLPAAVIGAPTDTQSPWTKVPAIPTGCYYGQDDFDKKIESAREALSAEIERQEQVNGAFSEKLSNLDPTEKQTRMQSFMMKNQQEAMKIMQATQTLGAEAQQAGPQTRENRQKLEAEHDDLLTKYKAAVDAVDAPIQAKISALPLADGEASTPQWATDQYIALLKKENGDYEKLCAEWWSASGPLRSWLGRFQAHLQAGIPLSERMDGVQKSQYAMFGIDAGSYRSTAGMKAVREYMDEAAKLLRERWVEPRKNMR